VLAAKVCKVSMKVAASHMPLLCCLAASRMQTVLDWMNATCIQIVQRGAVIAKNTLLAATLIQFLLATSGHESGINFACVSYMT
jgi:hypothetical protein